MPPMKAIEQHDARLLRRRRRRRCMISKLMAASPPAMPAKKAARQKAMKRTACGAVADELGALRVLAHRVAHAAERRAGDRVHGEDAHEGTRRRSGSRPRSAARSSQPKSGTSLVRLVVMPSSPPKKPRRISEQDADQLGEPERDHREDGAGAPRRDPAEDDAEEEAGEARRQAAPAAAGSAEPLRGDQRSWRASTMKPPRP